MKSFRVVFDLDTVLRDLGGYLIEKLKLPEPTTWIWKHKDRDLYWWIKKDNYNAILKSPPTPYVEIVKKYIEVPEIWTCQPIEWVPYTKRWLNKHIGKCKVIYLNTIEKRKKLDEQKDTILVEDCPLFSNYERIALVDKLYNRKVKVDYRIKNSEDFERLFTLDSHGLKCIKKQSN